MQSSSLDPLEVESLLARIVDEFTDCCLRGEAVDPERYARQYPTLAPLLSKVLPAIHVLGQKHPSGEKTLSVGTVPPAGTPTTMALTGYQILEELGRGGMGVVYRARHLALERTVALKVLHSHTGAVEKARDRFWAETRAVARLNHPGIVQIFEVGEQDKVAYCTLELVEGGSLAERTRGKPVPIPWAARVVEQMARAMQVAHTHGLIHRDLKPANVLLTADDTPKITDFGLVKQLDLDSGQTQTGAIVGTPSYMAPEQASGAKQIGPAVDIHALGAILFELITGRPPFLGSTLLETVFQVRHADPISPRQLQPACPRDLEVITLQCLRKEPERRYATAEELADELARFLTGQPIRARGTSSLEQGWLWTRRNPWLALLSGGLIASLLLGTTVAGILAGRWQDEANRAKQHAFQADEQRDEAVHQRKLADQALFESLMTQARAIRQRGGRGQRSDSLASLQRAVTLWQDKDFPDRDLREVRLRDEIISALMLPDVMIGREIRCDSTAHASVTFDNSFRLCSWAETGDVVVVARMADGSTLCRLHSPVKEQGAEPTLSPEGRYLAIYYWSGTVDVWDLQVQPPRRLFRDRAAHWSAAQFSPDGQNLALGGHHLLRLVSLPEGKERWQVKLPVSRQVSDMVWHPSRPLLACRQRDTSRVVVLDTQQGKLLGLLDQSSTTAGLGWHPTEPLLGIALDNGTIRFWDVSTRRPLYSVPLGHHVGLRFQFNSQGTLAASIAWDHQLMIWTPPSGVPLARIQVGPMGRLQFSPEGLEVGPELANNCIRTWRMIPETEYRRYLFHSHDGVIPALSPDGRLLALGVPSMGMLLYEVETGQLLDHRASLTMERLRFLTNDMLIGVPESGVKGGTHITQMRIDRVHGRFGEPSPVGRTPTPMMLDVTRDGRMVFQAMRSGAGMWEVDPPRTPADNPSRPPDRTFPGADIRYISVSPDGRWLACGSHLRRDVQVWDVPSNKLAATLPTSSWTFVAFGPTGKWLATHDGTCRLWEVGTWKEGPTVAASDRNKSIQPTFSPDERVVAIGDGLEGIRLIDTATGKDLAKLEVAEVVHRLEFSRDGRWLVVVSSRGGVGVLDLLRLRQGVEKMSVGWNLPVPSAASRRE